MEDNQVVATPEVEGQTTETTYSETQVMEMLQKEADRRVSQALAKQQAKFEAKMAESDKLRQMDAEQRSQYEFEQKLKDFEEQKREFSIMQNKLEATKVLGERGLPAQFVDYIVADDAETMLENINTFDKLFKAAVNDAVSKKIAHPAPKQATVGQTGLTKEQFKSMTLSQQVELYNSNKELYMQLSN